MFQRLVDFFVLKEDEEHTISENWLKVLVLAILGIIVPYGILELLTQRDWSAIAFAGFISIFFWGLYILLSLKQIRAVAMTIGLVSLGAMLYAAYTYGGVKSTSYFGITLALIITGMFMRTHVLIGATITAIAFGGLLVWAESTGLYHPNATYQSTMETWGSVSAIFALAALLVGIFRQVVKQKVSSEKREIRERQRAEQIVHTQERYFNALRETTLSIIQRDELFALMDSILKRACDLTKTGHGYIDMLLPGANSLIQVVGQGVFAELNHSKVEYGRGAGGMVLATGKTLFVPNYATWGYRIPEFSIGIRAIVAVPIKVQAQIIGVIGLAHVNPSQTFSRAQINYLEQFTELASLALESARLYQTSQDELNERKRAQEALAQANQQLAADTLTLERRSVLLRVAAEVSRAASAILDADELSRQAVEMVQKNFQLYYVGLFQIDEKGTTAILRAAAGQSSQEMLAQNHRLEIGSTSMVGWCIANRKARIALDVGEDAVRFNNPLLPLTRSELALPLISRGQVLGALSIQSAGEGAFSEEDIETFQTMADQLANAILNAHLYAQVEKELEERKRAEAKVRRLNADLENRVERRTEELQRRSLELQASNRELESFSYSVSHDLRAPLRALDGFSRILLDDYQEAIPEGGKIYLNRIREASKQMAQLIDDMLRLSRVTRAEMHFHPVNLSQMAQLITENLASREPERDVAVQIHENLVAQGDEGLLRMALENLLNNAWKFSSKTDHPEIEIGKIKHQGKEAFFIRDNGVGFDMAYADKLFTAFQRLHSPKDFPGTGIGLAIVQRVIHRHGGKIWAESEPDHGATFYFTL